MTSHVAVSVRINAPVKQVWETLSNLGGVMNYSAFVNNSYYDSKSESGVGCSRICEFDGMKVRETAVEWTPGKSYTLKVDFVEGGAPIENYVIAPRVVADGDVSIVYYDASYDVKMGIIGHLLDHLMIQKQIRSTMQRVLDGLKHHIETGETVADTNVLKSIPAIATSA